MSNPQPHSARPSPTSEEQRQLLSAAADGDAEALAGACQAWRGSAEARSTWHRYHLIGDVMRSSDLAQRPGRDEAFLQALRARMAAEPVVLAPAAPVPKSSASRWWVPAAAAAGFAVVAGVVVMVRQADPVAAPGPLAAVPQPAVRVSAPGTAVFVRDERLDEYLRAHQGVRGGMGAALPGGAIRRVELEVAAPR